MNMRDTVKRAIEFCGPTWIPYSLTAVPDQIASFSPENAAKMEWMRAALRDQEAEEVGGALRALPILTPVFPKESSLPEPFRPLVGDEWVDEWGVIWETPDFPHVSGHPLEEGWNTLDRLVIPDPRAPGRYDHIPQLYADRPDGYRLGHVWFTHFERLWFLRGFNNTLMDPYTHPKQFAELQNRLIAFSLEEIEEQLKLDVDGIFFSDDWGTQTGLLMNPDDWRKWFKPQYKRIFDAVHAGGAHVWMHLCGNVRTIVPDLIEVGLDVLNPIQPMAMDVDELAANFGGKVCFYGGADVQGTLPHGSAQDVEDEVKHLIEIFGCYNGGYIGSTSHTILPETPPENIVALFRAFRENSGWLDVSK